MLWPSVSLSVKSRCSTKMAKTGIIGPDKQHHTTAQGLQFSEAPAGRQMQVGWVKIGDFRQITGYISKSVQDKTHSFY